MTAPRVRQIVTIDGVRWRVVDVFARLTPYRHADQDTRIDGYTLGLRRVRPRRRRRPR